MMMVKMLTTVLIAVLAQIVKPQAHHHYQLNDYGYDDHCTCTSSKTTSPQPGSAVGLRQEGDCHQDSMIMMTRTVLITALAQVSRPQPGSAVGLRQDQ